MIVVRFVMKTKWGETDKVVGRMKEEMSNWKPMLGEDRHVRLLTDLSGPFHTVVQEMEFESLAAWEETRAQMFSNSDEQERMRETEPLIVDGYVEYYTLEAAM